MRPGRLFCWLIVLTAISAAQDTNFSAGPQYLMTNGSPLFAQPIATPSLALGTPLPGIPSLPAVGPVIGNQPYIANPGLEGQADLFPIYYGYPRISVVELASVEESIELPESILDLGVGKMTDVQSLRARGYGVTLPEAASYWKTHEGHASRIYTNADIERLRRD